MALLRSGSLWSRAISSAAATEPGEAPMVDFNCQLFRSIQRPVAPAPALGAAPTRRAALDLTTLTT